MDASSVPAPLPRPHSVTNKNISRLGWPHVLSWGKGAAELGLCPVENHCSRLTSIRVCPGLRNFFNMEGLSVLQVGQSHGDGDEVATRLCH